MRLLACLFAVCALAVAGCGEKEETLGTQTTPAEQPAAGEKPAEKKKPAAKEGTEVIVAGSEFGDMLYGADKQAIYIFENDDEGKSNCYDECAEAWPPVYTEGKPVAGDGVRQGLLGTTKRRDGKLQVTYDGQPLYFYVNEEPGEVRCHNVNLNGGFWWVVGPDGKRLD
jgi:predicted lipoprotein with Yx(FWY)xxD motif